MLQTLRTTLVVIASIGAMLSSPGRCAADELDAATEAKIKARLNEITAWAAEPAVVNAVKAQNQNPPAAFKDMDQAKWKSLSILDPAVRAFTRNDVGRFLKTKKDDAVSEAFVSSADGTKVGFLSKPTNWKHTGKPKHDQPMNGQTWRGPIEVDESTGVQQMQIAVPILDGDGKPIGSLVVGLDISKLKN